MSSTKSPEELRAADFGEKDKIAVEKAEAEELLPGWKIEVKVRKTDSAAKRLDRYYTDPVTGYIFHSLKDVQRYLKTGDLGRLATKPKDNDDEKLIPAAISSPMTETSRNKKSLENGSELAQHATKRPEPKTRQATRLAGIKVDESVQSSSEPKTRQAKQKAGIEVDEAVRSLPEPKTRQGKRKAGTEVDAPVQSSPEPKTRQARRLSGMEIVASTPSLPPEPKTRQAKQIAGLDIDASPPSLPPARKTHQAAKLTGMEIVSSPPSLPEPKTRQAKRLAGMEIVASPPSLPPERKTNRPKRLAKMEIDASPPSLPPECKTHQPAQLEIGASPPSPPQRKTRQSTLLAGMEIGASPPSLPERKTRQAKIRVDASPPEPRTTRQAAARCAREAETGKGNAVNLSAPKENDKPEKSICRDMQVECVGDITVKRDENADKRDYKTESSIIWPTSNQKCHDKLKELEFKAADRKQELRILFPPPIPSTPKLHFNEINTGATVLPPVSAPPTIVPPVNLHEKQELSFVNYPVNNPLPQDGYGGGRKPESSINFSLSDLWTDPCIEFAVKTLTGEIPFSDLKKATNFPPSALEAPQEELWTDPCIEFAVKTLTGAIPVEQDYLQHQSTSTSDPQTVHSFSLPDVSRNCCQTQVLSKPYETAQNKQQDSAIPGLPVRSDGFVGKTEWGLGNGGLQKPGNNIVVPQGNKGQCSRPWFFQ